MKTLQKIIETVIFNLFLVFIFYSVNGQKPSDYTVKLTTSITEDPPAINFTWESIPGDASIYIYRKNKEVAAWGPSIAKLPGNSTSYADSNVETGKEYEYRIFKSDAVRPIIIYVNSGIKCKETEYRGKVILLVDSTFVEDLQFELTKYENDLIGDGWEILRKDISRNANVKYVKSIIREFYNSDPVNVKALFLFGHIPVPYSGCEAYDGHEDHIGAWPADLYYGDMKEKTWTDVTANCIGAIRTENKNIPGDGKFDVTELPAQDTISLQIGRVDLYNLPVFPQSESDLLKNYLNKNHNFRYKINDPRLEGIVKDGYGWWYGDAMALSGWRNFTALFNSSHVKASDFFFPNMKYDSYIWSYGSGSGQISTNEFVNRSPRTVFNCLFASYWGDWDSQDNIMRSALASNGWILTCMWVGWPFYTFHQMGMGETIGFCIRTTQNNTSTYEQQWFNRCVHVGLLGDPTLRMHIVCPPNSLESAITANNTIMLAWKPADDSILGYYVYKLDTLTKKYNRITPEAVTSAYFEDAVTITGNNYYMVRTLKLDKVASGSYYNLSQGIFDTLNYVEQAPVHVTEIELAVNQGNVQPLKIYDSFSIDAYVSPENASNKLLKWSIESITATGKFDKFGKVYPEKGGILAVVAETLDGSGIKGRLEIPIDSIPDDAGIITGETSVCRNAKMVYTVPAIRGASSYLWTQQNGTTLTSVVNEIALTFDKKVNSGDIKVQGQNIYANGKASTLNISINEIPAAPVIALNDTVLLSNITSGNQWFYNGNIIPDAQDSAFIPKKTGVYSAKITVNNCISLESNRIQFKPTGMDLINLSDNIVLYPNPTTGELFLSFGSNILQEANIEIFNLQGKQVFSERYYRTHSVTIDLSGLPKETYLLKLTLDGIEVNRKLILTN